MNIKPLYLIVALFISLATSAFAQDDIVLETTFAGYPANSSQHDLNELDPHFFVAEKLERETGCLAVALYFEARGESDLGQTAVAQVILNRVRSRAYPSSICGVVWQNSHRRNRCQFSFTCDGKVDYVKNRKTWNHTRQLVSEFLRVQQAAGDKPVTPLDRLDKKTRRATHYHATYVKPRWSRKLQRMRKIGRHIFYVSARVERAMPTET